MNKIVITNYENRKFIIFLKDEKPVKIRVLSTDNFYPDAVFVGCVRKNKDNIDSSFVSYGNKQFGFLRKSNIKPGTLLPIIVKKQTEGRKEDVLTDKISLCGIYVVLHEESFSEIKFSSRLSEKCKEDFKEKLQHRLNCKDNDSGKNLDSVDAFDKYGVIIRANAVNADFESIINEYNYLKNKMDRIAAYANTRTEGTLLHHGLSECLSHIASENLNDYEEIVTDDKASADEINLFISEYNDAGITIPLKVRIYDDADYPLYKLISIKKLLSYATGKTVYLKSNAYITIEHTEAMTVIDVNTSTTSFKGSKSDVIHNVNMEAAEEVAAQLKLRNLSGIIIVDFINESTENNKQELIAHIKQLLKQDDAGAKFISYTKLGLVELTRPRHSKPLKEQLQK